MRPTILIVLYLGTTFLPLALAWSGMRPPRTFLDEIASGAGLLAFAIILVEFVLSGRFRSISGRIGMDVTMRFHQLLARTALVLAVVHPFLYRTPFAVQLPWDPTLQLTLTSNFTALASGAIAFVLLGAFVLLSIARDQLPFKYETWRLMHGLGAVLIAGFILHHTLGVGRYSQDPILAGVWIGLFTFAVATLLFVYFVEPLLQGRRAWRVTSVTPLALNTWEFALEPVGHSGLTYQAGQFVWLNVGNSAFSLHENPFSISSAPASGNRLEFVIKELGDFTGSIGRILPGTTAHIDGPHGNLIVTDQSEGGVALIAGGVGIAPLLGILRQMRLEGDQRQVVLIYGNRAEEQIVYRDELESLSAEPGTRMELVVSEPSDQWTGRTGVVDSRLIEEIFRSPEMRKWTFILCGPPAMMKAVEDTLIDIGVPGRQVLSERFKYD